MFNLLRTFWLDHVVDQSGAVIQQGTMQDQAHFNNLEEGLSDAHLAESIMMLSALQHRRIDDANQEATEAEVLGEYHTVTLTNNAAYPFNSTVDSPTTVALTKTRKNLYYSVEPVIDSSTGLPGNIHIKDKALNGFKVYFDGSATSVTVTLRIKGGMA